MCINNYNSVDITKKKKCFRVNDREHIMYAIIIGIHVTAIGAIELAGMPWCQ